jgi:hypothetical protein
LSPSLDLSSARARAQPSPHSLHFFFFLSLFFFHFPSHVIACDLDLTQEPNQTKTVHLRSDTAALPITDYLAAPGGDQIATRKKSSEIKGGNPPH